MPEVILLILRLIRPVLGYILIASDCIDNLIGSRIIHLLVVRIEHGKVIVVEICTWPVLICADWEGRNKVVVIYFSSSVVISVIEVDWCTLSVICAENPPWHLDEDEKADQYANNQREAATDTSAVASFASVIESSIGAKLVLILNPRSYLLHNLSFLFI